MAQGAKRLQGDDGAPAEPEAEAAVRLDGGDHDADLVHVGAEHDVGPAAAPRGRDPGDQAPHRVDLERIDVVPDRVDDRGAHALLAPAHADRVGERLEEPLLEQRGDVPAHFKTSVARHATGRAAR